MRILILFIFLLFTTVSKADAWDNLTHDQAQQVKHFVLKNPYIFDYCDCCGSGVEAYLIKVEEAKIVPCEWDEKQFSVLTKGRRIAKMQWANVGLDDYHTDPIEEEVEYTIYMNYTFAFDRHMKWAVPLFKLISYSNDGPICVGATNYPNPLDEGVKITNESYIQWYRHHIKSIED